MVSTSTAVDPSPGDRQPSSTRRRWLVLALGLVLVGAFAVQATSTWRGGDRHNLAGLALPALILVLEVGAITGAAIYVVTRDDRTRRRAGLLVLIVTSVGATFGVQAYGFLIGLPVAGLLLLMVDLIGRFWHESASPAATADEGDTSADSEADVDTIADIAGDSDEQPEEPDERWEQAEEPDEREQADGPAPLPEVRGVEPHVVAQAVELLEREPLAGRPRLRAYLGITDHRAGLVLAALRPLQVVGGEAS